MFHYTSYICVMGVSAQLFVAACSFLPPKTNSILELNKAGYTAQDAPSMRSFHLRK